MLFSTKNNAATVLCVGVCSIEKTAIYFFELFVTLSLKAYHHNLSFFIYSLLPLLLLTPVHRALQVAACTKLDLHPLC